MSKLKPCPHCGCPRVGYFNGWKFGTRKKDKSKWRDPTVTCQGCGCGFHVGTFGRGISDKEAKEITIRNWNRRNDDCKMKCPSPPGGCFAL